MLHIFFLFKFFLPNDLAHNCFQLCEIGSDIYFCVCVCACVCLILFISDLNFTLSEHQYNEVKVTFTA